MIPLFTFEEHHEAFFIWHYAIAENLMPKADNILLHIDEHADFCFPSFQQPLETLDTTNLSDLYQFTYNQLNIANFIVPALYQGVFKQEYWIRHPHPKLSTKMRTLRVHAIEQNATHVLAQPMKKEELGIKKLFKWLNDPTCKLAKLQHLTVDDEFPDDQTVVLDIDLDYFSCSEEVYEAQGIIEITEEEYQLINDNRYHFLRIFHGSRCSTFIEEGKYYVKFYDYPYTDTSWTRKLTVSEEEIVNRVEKLVKFLVDHKVQLQYACICRSRISGYTPDNQCEFIEKTLIEKLGQAYDINPISIDRILEDKGLKKTLAMV